MLSGLFAPEVLSGKLPWKKEINQGGNFKSQSINEAAARKFFSTQKNKIMDMSKLPAAVKK